MQSGPTIVVRRLNDVRQRTNRRRLAVGPLLTILTEAGARPDQAITSARAGFHCCLDSTIQPHNHSLPSVRLPVYIFSLLSFRYETVRVDQSQIKFYTPPRLLAFSRFAEPAFFNPAN